MFKKCLLLAAATFCLLSQGCSVMYFHNGYDSYEDQTTAQENLEFSQTQHDGVLAYITEYYVAIEDNCANGNWQTVKAENTLFDIVVRFIANPLYGSSTVSYNCEQAPTPIVAAVQSEQPKDSATQ